MRKKTFFIIMGVVFVLTLALVLTGCGKKEPHEETYDRYTDQVWEATRDDGHGYIIQFWPDGVCYIIRTYGENWTGATKRNYTVAEQTRQPVIGDGEFIVALSNDEQTMNVIMPDGESWDFYLTNQTRTRINETWKDYEEIFKGMHGPQGGNSSSTPGNQTNPNNTADPSTHPNISPNANGKYEYSIIGDTFQFESDINVWDYIDSDNNFDLVRLLGDWGFESINISLTNRGATAESKSRNMGIIINLDDSSALNDYDLRPAVSWMLVNKSFTVYIGMSHTLDTMYPIKGYAPWGMSLDEIEFFAYFVQYGASNKSDPYYMENFGASIGRTNEYRLP